MVSPSEATEWIDAETFIFDDDIFVITPDVRIIKIGFVTHDKEKQEAVTSVKAKEEIRGAAKLRVQRFRAKRKFL